MFRLWNRSLALNMARPRCRSERENARVAWTPARYSTNVDYISSQVGRFTSTYKIHAASTAATTVVVVEKHGNISVWFSWVLQAVSLVLYYASREDANYGMPHCSEQQRAAPPATGRANHFFVLPAASDLSKDLPLCLFCETRALFEVAQLCRTLKTMTTAAVQLSKKRKANCLSLTVFRAFSPALTSAAFEGSALALPANLDAASSARSRACFPSSALKFLALLLMSSLYVFFAKDTFSLAVFLRELGFGRDAWTLRHHLDIAAGVWGSANKKQMLAGCLVGDLRGTVTKSPERPPQFL